MRLIFTGNQLPLALTDIEDIVAKLRVLNPELLRTREQVTADGYPRQSLSEGGGSGQEPEIDAKGRPIHDEVTGQRVMAPKVPHGDPTAEAVILRVEGQRDESYRALCEFHQAVNTARKVLDGALGRIENALKPPANTDDITPGPVDWCRSCIRTDPQSKKPTSHSPVYDRPWARAEHLCRWCGEYWKATGNYPPLQAVDMAARYGAQAAGKWLAQHRRAS